MSLSANWAPWSSLALSLSEPSGPRRDFFLRSPTTAEPGAAPKAILREAAPPQPASSLPKCTTGGETSEGRRTTERSPSRTLAPDTLCPRAARPAGWPVTTRLSQGHGGGEGTPSTRQRALASEKHACGDRGREGRERDVTLQSVARRTVPSSRIRGCWMFTSIPGSRRPVCLVKT